MPGRRQVINTNRTPNCGICGSTMKTVAVRKGEKIQLELCCSDENCRDGRVTKGRYAILLESVKERS